MFSPVMSGAKNIYLTICYNEIDKFEILLGCKLSWLLRLATIFQSTKATNGV